jgi:hypothetical protein
MNELFPKMVRPIGCMMINVCGTMASSTTPIIMGAIIRAHISPFIVFAMAGWWEQRVTLFLKETFQQPILSEIEEEIG